MAQGGQLFLTLSKVIKKSLTNGRYWKSERAFQSEFYCNLKKHRRDLIPQAAIPETEYQKIKSVHGLTARPDLIVHIPFESGHTRSRKEGSEIVFEFKVRSTLRKAISDFYKLNKFIEKLNYQKGIFINIDSDGRTFLSSYRGENKEKIHELSVFRDGNKIKIKHCFIEEGKTKKEFFE